MLLDRRRAVACVKLLGHNTLCVCVRATLADPTARCTMKRFLSPLCLHLIEPGARRGHCHYGTGAMSHFFQRGMRLTYKYIFLGFLSWKHQLRVYAVCE